MGISSSGDLFNQTTNRIIEGMSNIVKEVDDVLLFSDTIKGVTENLEEMLSRFEANNVTLAPKKFQFGTEVKFAGMRITKDGCAADPDRMTAVEQLPRPESRSQVRQVLGLVQQFSQWVPDIAPATVSMRSLLRNNAAFVWSPECEVEFQQMKAVLSDEKFIKPFDPDLDTELLVDTSKVSGCGYILLQRTQDGSIHIIRCGSMAAKRGWAGMSPIESECTGIGWAVEHCSYYLKGTSKVVRVVTDHFPLVRVFNKCMGDLSQRLWNVRSRLMDYKIEVCWVPGKQQMAADALGRNPVWHGTAENNQEGEDSGYEEARFIADDYKQEHVFEEEFEDPMLE